MSKYNDESLNNNSSIFFLFVICLTVIFAIWFVAMKTSLLDDVQTSSAREVFTSRKYVPYGCSGLSSDGFAKCAGEYTDAVTGVSKKAIIYCSSVKERVCYSPKDPTRNLLK